MTLTFYLCTVQVSSPEGDQNVSKEGQNRPKKHGIRLRLRLWLSLQVVDLALIPAMKHSETGRLLIRRSLVRAQLGEPKKLRGFKHLEPP
jgi:hypothetical protein